jgi:hypothetical protein
LSNAKEMLKIFKDDLEEHGLQFPMFPEHIMKAFNIDKKEK